jgi:hypothetical protein
VNRLTPLLLLLLAAVAAGCGSANEAAAPTAAATAAAPVKPEHVRTLPKRTFVRRANAICARLAPGGVGARTAMSPGVRRHRGALAAWAGRMHAAMRGVRRRLVHLGEPSRDRAGWRRAMSKLRAVEGHLDTLRASAWSGDATMLSLSARQLDASGTSADRRFRRFGATRCA